MKTALLLALILILAGGAARAQTPSLDAHRYEPCAFVLPHGSDDLAVVRAALGSRGTQLQSWDQVHHQQTFSPNGGTCEMTFPDAVSTRLATLSIYHTDHAKARYCAALMQARHFQDFPLRPVAGLGEAAFVQLAIIAVDGPYFMRAMVTGTREQREAQLRSSGVVLPDVARTRAFLRAVIAGIGPVPRTGVNCR